MDTFTLKTNPATNETSNYQILLNKEEIAAFQESFASIYKTTEEYVQNSNTNKEWVKKAQKDSNGLSGIIQILAAELNSKNLLQPTIPSRPSTPMGDCNLRIFEEVSLDNGVTTVMNELRNALDSSSPEISRPNSTLEFSFCSDADDEGDSIDSEDHGNQSDFLQGVNDQDLENQSQGVQRDSVEEDLCLDSFQDMILRLYNLLFK